MGNDLEYFLFVACCIAVMYAGLWVLEHAQHLRAAWERWVELSDASSIDSHSHKDEIGTAPPEQVAAEAAAEHEVVAEDDPSIDERRSRLVESIVHAGVEPPLIREALRHSWCLECEVKRPMQVRRRRVHYHDEPNPYNGDAVENWQEIEYRSVCEECGHVHVDKHEALFHPAMLTRSAAAPDEENQPEQGQPEAMPRRAA